MKVSHLPRWILKYFPLKALKLGKRGLQKSKAMTSSIIQEMESKQSTPSDELAEGTFYEQFKAQGMPYATILSNICDFLAGGTDTVSVMCMLNIVDRTLAGAGPEKK
jgi:hypothetical protein